ncbi:MAG: Unknown protein [uncultured Sulfurovum sp.]|uniref:HNH domain-containing protein n=1 Tax=uncultured Sulfurovum sp. TaxID=269237 RepID=A0A6S6RZ77_9BACT|nr:MAG: Unknown protein [uncultured Sulfurovum sp.]
MSALYEHDDYQEALNTFNNSSCKWSSFVNIHMKVSKNRCPICEYLFEDNSQIRRNDKHGNNLLVSTIDHYRPKNKEFYPFLKCDHSNYLLMCFECNSSYKKSKFPLYNSMVRATNKSELINEKPLIVNPILDDVYELFILVFREISNGKKILELKPKENIGYLHDKALETIKVFGLGNCEVYKHTDENIHNCRIQVLISHYGSFYNFAKIMNSSKKDLFREKIKNSSGFLQFIAREQFEIIE